jgi:mannose-1-phosphate guanylyltransferase
MIDKIKLKSHFLERDIFPALAQEGNLYCQVLNGFWMDIGQPKDYLIGIKFYLQFLKNHNSEMLSKGDNIIGNVMIHPSAKVDPGSVMGPNVVIGENCTVERGVRISDTCVMSKTLIKSHSFIRHSIIGSQSIVGQWVRIEGISVVAEDV